MWRAVPEAQVLDPLYGTRTRYDPSELHEASRRAPGDESDLELIRSAAILRRGIHALATREQLRTWSEALSAIDLETLWTVIDAENGYIPDFLVPAPTEPLPDPGTELDRVAGADLKEVQGQLRILFADPANWVDRPAEFRSAIVKDMRQFWDRIMAPNWHAHQAIIESEVLGRGKDLALHGAGHLLSGLHRDVEWHGSHNRLDVACDAVDLELACGEELQLVPSVSAWPDVFVGPPDSAGRATVYYPARGAAALFAEERAHRHRHLEGLVGPSRAALLRELRAAATTTDLARRMNLSASAVSQHIQKLRSTGLLARTRVGRKVYYELSDTGRRLIALLD